MVKKYIFITLFFSTFSTLSFGKVEYNIAPILRQHNKRLTIKRSRELDKAITKYSTEFDVYYKFVMAVIITESDVRNLYGDNYKSIGYMQIQYRTIEHMYKIYKDEYNLILPKEEDFIRAPSMQILYGILYIKYIKDSYGISKISLNYGNNDFKDVFSTYNAGMSGYLNGRYNSGYHIKVYNHYKLINQYEIFLALQ